MNFATESFNSAATSFLENYINKFELHATRTEKWKPWVFQKISADQLMTKLGGTSTNWKLHRIPESRRSYKFLFVFVDGGYFVLDGRLNKLIFEQQPS